MCAAMAWRTGRAFSSKRRAATTQGLAYQRNDLPRFGLGDASVPGIDVVRAAITAVIPTTGKG